MTAKNTKSVLDYRLKNKKLQIQVLNVKNIKQWYTLSDFHHRALKANIYIKFLNDISCDLNQDFGDYIALQTYLNVHKQANDTEIKSDEYSTNDDEDSNEDSDLEHELPKKKKKIKKKKY